MQGLGCCTHCKNKDEDKPNKGKGIKCHECEDFCHIKVECPTFLKKWKKGMSITQSDFDDKSEEKTDNKLITFTEKYEFGSESSDEEITDEELVERYKHLYSQWKESCMVGEKQKKTMSALLLEKEKLVSTITGLEEEITLLNSQL